MNTDPTRRVPIEPQSVDAPLTESPLSLVPTPADNPDAAATVRSTLAAVADVAKNVAFRDLGGSLSCTVGIGSRVWDSIVGSARPSELHPFPPLQGRAHTAVSTPGDLLFHIRADRHDLIFELERQLLDLLGDAVAVADDPVGFRVFDSHAL